MRSLEAFGYAFVPDCLTRSLEHVKCWSRSRWAGHGALGARGSAQGAGAGIIEVFVDVRT